MSQTICVPYLHNAKSRVWITLKNSLHYWTLFLPINTIRSLSENTNPRTSSVGSALLNVNNNKSSLSWVGRHPVISSGSFRMSIILSFCWYFSPISKQYVCNRLHNDKILRKLGKIWRKMSNFWRHYQNCIQIFASVVKLLLYC